MRLTSWTTLILGSVIWISCDNQISFDSRKWKTEEDLKAYPFREAMIDDIIQNRKFIGLNVAQVSDTLGQPNALENKRLFYSIRTDYGQILTQFTPKTLF